MGGGPSDGVVFGHRIDGSRIDRIRCQNLDIRAGSGEVYGRPTCAAIDAPKDASQNGPGVECGWTDGINGQRKKDEGILQPCYGRSTGATGKKVHPSSPVFDETQVAPPLVLLKIRPRLATPAAVEATTE